MSMKDGLLQSQKNEVFLAIREAGMDPAQFKLHERADFYPQLVHEPSRYSFAFGPDYASFNPGSETQSQVVNKLNWTGKLSILRLWFTYMQREIEAPDLWGSLAEERELMGAEPTEAVNTPFSKEEQGKIRLAVDEIRAYITKAQSLSEDNLRRVNVKLDYLIDASEHLGRVHWKDIFVSTLIGIAWQLALPAPGFRDLLSFAWQILRQVLGSVLSPPLLH